MRFFMRFFTILGRACGELTAITQLPFSPPAGGAVKGPEGPPGGRSNAKRLDGAEDGGMIEPVMAGQHQLMTRDMPGDSSRGSRQHRARVRRGCEPRIGRRYAFVTPPLTGFPR